MYNVEFDPNSLSEVGRSPEAGTDPVRDARKNRVEFVYDYKIDPAAVKSGQKFLDCFKKRLFIKIATPTTKDVAYLPATESDKQLYAAAYNAFLQKQKLEETGTPLHSVRYFAAAQRDCYFMGIYTIEQLAAHNQQELEQNGLGIFRLLAQRWLSERTVPKQGASVIPAVTEDKPKSKRGRPKKQAADADH